MLNERLKQVKEKQEQAEADRLVAEYRKNHEKGEFRNKLGRIWWPLWHKVVIPAVSGVVVLAGVSAGITFGGAAAVPLLATGAVVWGIGATITKGFSVDVQNIAIKNAGIFGRQMTRNRVPDRIKKRAILTYLDKSGALFFNRAYVKQNPCEIDKMAKGEKGETINNLVAMAEYNLTRECNHAKKRGKSVPFKKKVEIYRQSYRTYRFNKEQMALLKRGGGR